MQPPGEARGVAAPPPPGPGDGAGGALGGRGRAALEVLRDPGAALRRRLFSVDTEGDIRSRDPRYRVRSTYRKGLPGALDAAVVYLLMVPKVREALALLRDAGAEVRGRARQAGRRVSGTPAVRWLRQESRAFGMRVQDEYISRVQKRFLMEKACEMEVAIMEPYVDFLRETACLVAYQLLSPPTALWTVAVPVILGWLRSVAPGRPPKPDGPFPWAVPAGILLCLPFKFGDEFFLRLSSWNFFGVEILSWAVAVPLAMAFLHRFCRGWDNWVYSSLEGVVKSIYYAVRGRWSDVRLPGVKPPPAG